MAKKRPQPERPLTTTPKPTLPPIPAEAALSYLKDTKGALKWSVRDLADTLKISRRDAEQVIALLAAQGYVQSATGTDEWMTTPAGESVSGAKPPRFTREIVERAAESLKERIKQVNKDSKAAFRISDAVAFGDFLLSDRTRVQAADVGIGLMPRGEAVAEPRSAPAAKAERQFFRQLRGKTALLHVRPYADWMSKRSHLNLM
jgi:DNA-binding transcriptional regulator YhcF (GntR family)